MNCYKNAQSILQYFLKSIRTVNKFSNGILKLCVYINVIAFIYSTILIEPCVIRLFLLQVSQCCRDMCRLIHVPVNNTYLRPYSSNIS